MEKDETQPRLQEEIQILLAINTSTGEPRDNEESRRLKEFSDLLYEAAGLFEAENKHGQLLDDERHRLFQIVAALHRFQVSSTVEEGLTSKLADLIKQLHPALDLARLEIES